MSDIKTISSNFRDFLENHPDLDKSKATLRRSYVNLLAPDGAVDRNIKSLEIPGFTTSYECLNTEVWSKVILPLYKMNYSKDGLKKMESDGTYWSHIAAINKYIEFLSQNSDLTTERFDWDKQEVSDDSQAHAYLNPEKIKALFKEYFDAYLLFSTGKNPKSGVYMRYMEEYITPIINSVDPSINSIYQISDSTDLEDLLENIALKDPGFEEYRSLSFIGKNLPPKKYGIICALRQYRTFLKLFSKFRKAFIEKTDTAISHDVTDLVDSTFTDDLAPIILYGPPGTGKTHSLREDYVKKFDKRLVYFTTFHQSFTYEEFVEGLKPILDENTSDSRDNSDVKYRIEKGVFYRACEKAAELAGYDSLKDCLVDNENNRKLKFNQAIRDKKLVLLCIDEINRGNVASIFGDLISLIEPGKRLGAGYELTLTLPYSKSNFGVPANLVIVGTMNTADRSIQLLDTALRRRFKFKECPPRYDVIDNQTASNVLKYINARIRSILNKDNQIGHSYFMDAKSNVEILDAICTKVIPLLEEYFYNNVDKIRFILNDTSMSGVHFYLEDKEAKDAAKNYPNGDVDTAGTDFYELNPEIGVITDEQEAGEYLKLIIGE